MPNLAPEGGTPTRTINEDGSYTFVASDFGFTDPDGNQFLAVVITTLPKNGTLRLNGVSVIAGQEIALASISQLTFTPAPNGSGAGYGDFEFQVRDDGPNDASNEDQNLDQSSNVFTLNVDPVNDAPTLSGAAARATFIEGSVAPLMQGVTLSDVDAPASYAGGSINLSVTGSGGGISLRVGSKFRIDPVGEGTFALSLEVANSDGSTEVFAIGQIGGIGTNNVQITNLVTSATPERLNDLLDEFVYGNTADNPDTADRSVTLTVNDGGNAGGGGLSATSTQTLAVVPVNDAPTLSGLQGDNATYTEGSAPVRLDVGSNALVADPDGGRFEVKRVATNLAGVLYIAPVPDDSGRLFVVQKHGVIQILDPSTESAAPVPFLDISAQVPLPGEQGLLGFVTAPDFVASGIFYVYLTNHAGDIEVRRYWTMADNPDRADPASGDIILQIPHPGTNVHHGGWMEFGPDGMLYITVGDGSPHNDIFGNSQNPNVLLGKILRIDVSSDDFPDDPFRDYAIPADNPFVDGGGRPEVFALGFRNPYRASFDPDTGNLYVGDVGQDGREEVSLIRPTDGGRNYGWPVREGTVETGLPSGQPGGPPASVPPVLEYGHGSSLTDGKSITGGYVYRGPIEELRGQYIFGDFITGRIWSVPVESLVQGSTLKGDAFTLLKSAFEPTVGGIRLISTFGLDQRGNIFIGDYADGEVYQARNTDDFAAGSLTVAITANKVAAEDRLQIETGAATNVTLSNGTNAGSEVRVGGTLIGVVATGGTGIGADNLVIRFTNGATPDLVTKLVQALTYANSNLDSPTAGTRTITYTLTDGWGTANGGQNTSTTTSTVTVNQVNDAPALTSPTVGTISYAENATPTGLMQGVTLSDPDLPANFAGGSVSLTVSGAGGGINLRSASDFRVNSNGDGTFSLALEITNSDGSKVQLGIGQVSGIGTNNVQITKLISPATTDRLNDLLDDFTWFVPGDTPIAGNRRVTLTFSDGGNNGGGALTATRTQILNVASSNDAPTTSNLASDSVTFAEPEDGGTPAPVLLDAGGNALIADVDSANFGGGSLTIAVTGSPAAQDQLTVIMTGETAGQIGFSNGQVRFGGVHFATMSGGLNSPLVFTFNDNATPAAVQALARQVAYLNTGGDAPVPGSRTISWTLVDGDGTARGGSDTAILTTTVDVVAKNDAPVLTQPSSETIAFTENGPGVLLMQGVTLNDADTPASFQGGSLTLVVSGSEGAIGLRPGSVVRTTDNGDGSFTLALQEGSKQVSIGTVTGIGTLNVQVSNFNASATLARVRDLIDEFAFSVSGDNPAPGTRTVTLTFSDGGNSGGGSLTSTQVQNLTVIAVDDLATAGNDGFTTDEATAVTGSLFDNDADVDGPAPSVSAVNGSTAAVGQAITLPSGAVLKVNADGTFNYNPNGAFNYLPPASSGASNTVATDRFTYMLAGGSTATVTFTINGLESNDRLVGSAAADVLVGGAGDDRIGGLGGNDEIGGGGGADGLFGDGGDDRIRGGTGNDYISGGLGNDTLRGDEDDDFLVGDDGDDLLEGGTGNDQLHGGSGQDRVNGGAGDDYIDGGVGADGLFGDAGNDRIIGGAGSDYLSGGAGNDALYGSEDDDFLIGDDGDDYLDGGSGKDQLHGGAGNDRLGGGEGDDYLDGGSGADGLFGDAGNDRIVGGAGSDYLSGGTGNDELHGNADDDFITGDDGDDYLDGGTGNDQLHGGAGNDRVIAQDGNDYIDGAAGADALFGGDGDDIILGGAGGDYVSGGSGNDVIRGEADDDFLVGDEGDDTLEGGTGADQLHGGSGNDTLIAGAGGDYVDAGAGNDRILGGEGADFLIGGAGLDVFAYNDASESLAASADRIADFTAGEKIDLVQVDGNVIADGRQSFVFIGSAAFSAAGQLRVTQNGGEALIEGDRDGDGKADFAISVGVSDGHTLSAASFTGIVDGSGGAGASAQMYAVEPVAIGMEVWADEMFHFRGADFVGTPGEGGAEPFHGSGVQPLQPVGSGTLALVSEGAGFESFVFETEGTFGSIAGSAPAVGAREVKEGFDPEGPDAGAFSLHGPWHLDQEFQLPTSDLTL
jgi:Ca2+-binding RTX toxin-like protein/glucose/arabinose dehydrogenase